MFDCSFFSITGQGIDLDYCDIEWLALETDRDGSVAFETAPKYCILDSFVDCEGSSISSKGFLPTVVDITSWLSAGNSEMKNTWCVSASPSDGEEWDSMC